MERFDVRIRVLVERRFIIEAPNEQEARRLATAGAVAKDAEADVDGGTVHRIRPLPPSRPAQPAPPAPPPTATPALTTPPAAPARAPKGQATLTF